MANLNNGKIHRKEYLRVILQLGMHSLSFLRNILRCIQIAMTVFWLQTSAFHTDAKKLMYWKGFRSCSTTIDHDFVNLNRRNACLMTGASNKYIKFRFWSGHLGFRSTFKMWNFAGTFKKALASHTINQQTFLFRFYYFSEHFISVIKHQIERGKWPGKMPTDKIR